jgi:hypothetical protein
MLMYLYDVIGVYEMSSKQDLSKPHRCIFKKCKGVIREPADRYGYWAYWLGSSDPKLIGWWATPHGPNIMMGP